MLDELVMAGFIVTYGLLMMFSEATPKWLQALQDRWTLWDGKPINCRICMSFWISLVLSCVMYRDAVTLVTHAIAGASVGLLVYWIMERLRTYVG